MLAKEDIQFMNWIDITINPKLDLNTLDKGDDKTTIYYLGREGLIKCITACKFFLNLKKHKGKFVESQKNVLACEYKVFLDWFDFELNLDINLSTLYKSDNTQPIYYKNPSGKIGVVRCVAFFSNVIRNHGTYMGSRNKEWGLAIDRKEFADWFDRELNLHVDLSQLLANDRRVPIYHRYGEVIKKTYAYHFFYYNSKKKEKRCTFSSEIRNTKSNKYLNRKPWYSAYIMKYYKQELNPHVTQNILTNTDYSLRINYENRAGKIKNVSFKSFIQMICRKEKLILTNPRKTLKAKDIPGFMELFNTELNREIDLENLSVSDAQTKLYYINSNGKRSVISALNYQKNVKRNGEEFKDDTRYQLVQESMVFMTWFDMDLNQGIELNSLCENDKKTKLKYWGRGGMVKTITPYNFFRNVSENGGVFEPPSYERKIKDNIRYQLAQESTVFMTWFDMDLNQGIELDSLYMNDKKTKLKYWGKRGMVETITPYNFFKNVSENGGVFKLPDLGIRKGLMACESAEFMKRFDVELNPHIDICNLRMCDSKQDIYLRGDNNNIILTNANSFYLKTKENDGEYKEDSRNYLACGDELFCKWFDRNMNPGVDLKKLKMGDNKTELAYRDNRGNVGIITAKEFFQNVWKNKGIFRDRDEGKLACDDKDFMLFFNPEMNTHINLYSLRKSDKKQRIYFKTEDGQMGSIYAYSFFQRHKCQTRKRIRSKKKTKQIANRPVEMDDTLRLFWNEGEIDIETIGWDDKTKYHLCCPFCGEELYECLSDVAMRIPKCPKCKDGHIIRTEMMREGNIFLYHMRVTHDL